ncbi:ATP-binding protein [Shivajiella indica]|uniref:ATP-binding protein n=1 Tax=Shivajiella indica TaxID=872115 RepID=A0ABW5BD95_9BACT
MKAADMNICPYTGLRSFTEDESIYFKGRDHQIDQLSALLEENKFLMVTGASGEGKSSLIYAGLIPNARAGFFKAKYTNWVVADFRPERSPVKNMASAIAEKFNIPDSTVEIELRRGFSSMIDLYTNSDFYIDEQDEKWQQLEETEQRKRKRKASNLMIIVDQFEEFFTNPENFYKEAPSQDSQIVVNLILETARIALIKNIPVYVVCTMRSDYIGQCSAFRGLPEYIGFSQFFVPRLKRKDLKQVIEEPAILSGNRISQRLIERLVYDLAEGLDQLPILQHALTQIWLAADSGSEEMDLIHYAKVGGMPANELPDNDQKLFLQWFKTLPEHQRVYYHQTGLNKVIEIHASILFENAWEYYNKTNPENPISQQEAKRIIALTFSGLTKIDNSRAVRNRMSLGELTEIINTHNLNSKVVGGVLNIFREEGNSFIRPFKTEDPDTHILHDNTVLDITHESLIRNWNKLNAWANQEFEFYSIYLDFKKQLDRWKDNGKSRNFLLPIGPLSFFENWYEECKPNVGWIKRYSEIKKDDELRTKEAKKLLDETKEFLKRSSRNAFFTRTFMKYGPQKIGTFFAILVMVVLSGFYWYDAEQKANERVIERARKESLVFLSSPEVLNQDKAVYLLAEERFEPGYLTSFLSSMDQKDRITQAIDTYKFLIYVDKHIDDPIKDLIIDFIYGDLKSPDAQIESDYILAQTNKFLFILMRDNYYSPSVAKEKIISDLTEKNKQRVLDFYKGTGQFSPTVPFELNLAIQLWLTAGKAKIKQIDEVLSNISPKESEEGRNAFLKYYPKGSFEPNGRLPTDFNNGYHTLASLYASKGDINGVEWAFDQLLDNGQREYFELGRVFNNHQNILGYLYQYKFRDLAPRLVKWISTNTFDNPEITVYRNTIIRSGYITHLYIGANLEPQALRSYRGYIYPNLFFSERYVFDQMSEDYEFYINQIKDISERNYQLAINTKRRAVFTHKYWFDRQMEINQELLDSWFDLAFDYYSTLNPAFLEEKIASTIPYFGDGVRTTQPTRKELFIYPDYRDGWFSWNYHSDIFYHYMDRKGLLSKMFETGDDLQTIHFWIAKAFEVKPFPPPGTLDNNYILSDETLTQVLNFIERHPKGAEVDKNLFYLILANRSFEKSDTVKGFEYYRKFDQQSISRSSNKYEYVEKNFFLNMMIQLAVNLAQYGKTEESVELAERFPSDAEKAFPYILMAKRAYQGNSDPQAFVYLDSVSSKTAGLDFNVLPQSLDSRPYFINVLSTIGSQSINNLTLEILRDIPEQRKFDAVFQLVSGIAREGNYYRALMAIPNSLTESQDLRCRGLILLEASKRKEIESGDSRWKELDNWLGWTETYFNFLPN